MQSVTNQKLNRIASRATVACLMLVLLAGCRKPSGVERKVAAPDAAPSNAAAPADGSPIEPFEADLDLLLERLRDRLRLMPAVARYKWKHHSPIEDAERERLLIDRFVTQAEGLDANWSRRVISAQIAAARRVQQDWFERWRTSPPDDSEPVLDLQTELRPRIERVTEELIEVLVGLERHRESARFREVFPTRSDSIITGDSISDEVRQLAVSPWLEGEIRVDTNPKP